MQDVLALILGGGRGDRLFPLTKHRSEPAVPIGGKYRLIDIPISNCINSDVRRIYVLTQYMSVSLHRHISNTYKLSPFSQGFVEVLAAQQTNEGGGWFRGTADAIRQNLHYLHIDSSRDVLILFGDQLYRMDFRQVLATHRDSQADATLAVVPVDRRAARQLGIVQVDAGGRVVRFVEKPSEAELEALRTPADRLAALGLAADRGEWLANTGIALFRRAGLMEWLQAHPDAMDLVREIIIPSLERQRVYAHPFGGYWQDVGSIRTYYEANLALCDEQPPFDFHDPEGVIYTRMRNLPASRILAAKVEDSLVSDGCVIEEGAEISHCVIGVRSIIRQGARLRDVVMLGANDYEGQSESAYPGLGVGEGARLEGVILDRNARIGKDVTISNRSGIQLQDADNYYIRDGVVVIPTNAVIRDGSAI